MDTDLLKQRIRCIVEFGGIFPPPPRTGVLLMVIAFLIATGDGIALARLLLSLT
jgi:hypothetical protein